MAIIESLKAAGATVQRLSVKGAPDLLVGFRGENYLLEVKTSRGKLTEDQEFWREAWQGSRVITVRTPESALLAIGASD